MTEVLLTPPPQLKAQRYPLKNHYFAIFLFEKSHFCPEILRNFAKNAEISLKMANFFNEKMAIF